MGVCSGCEASQSCTVLMDHAACMSPVSSHLPLVDHITSMSLLLLLLLLKLLLFGQDLMCHFWSKVNVLNAVAVWTAELLLCRQLW